MKNQPFYKTILFIIFMLIFLFPVGLFLMSYSKKFNNKTRYTTLSLIFIVFLSLTITGCSNNNKAKETLATNNTETITESYTENSTLSELIESTTEDVSNNILTTSTEYTSIQLEETTQEITTETTTETTSLNEQSTLETTTKFVSSEATSESTTQKQEVIPAQEPQVKNNSENEMVYVGNSGNKYHYKDCRTLKGKGHAITLQQAVSEGRTSCKVCNR